MDEDNDRDSAESVTQDTAGAVRLVPYRRWSRADIQAMVDADNAADWPSVLSHEDTLLDWNDEQQSGHIERRYTVRYPSPIVDIAPFSL